MDRLTVAIIVVLALVLGAATALAEEAVSVELALEPAQQGAGATATARFHFTCAGDHYVQKEGLRIELADAGGAEDGVYVADLVFPEPHSKRDEVLGEVIQYFDGEFTVDAVLRIAQDLQPGEYALDFRVRYQACRPGFCLLEQATPRAVLTVLPAQEGRTAPEETDVEPRSAARTASVEETADRFA
ncbi:MAG: protein-disulfide reductase DsbD family protein, partial [Candidatus Brocadiaceae bacterium]